MDKQLYRETLLEVFRNPPNKGEIKDPDLEARLVNPLCGDEIKLQLQLAESTRPPGFARRSGRGKQKAGDKVIKRAVFSGNGCAISQASASLLAEHIEGKGLTEVKKLDSKDILKLIGIKPTPARVGCVLLGLNVLNEAIQRGR
jgi:nitrogen fixation NifU-like protein